MAQKGKGIRLDVAPYGADSNAGTEEAPVRTLSEALARTRSCGSADKRIIVRAGEYEDVSLVLTAEDAGLTIEAYPNEYPVLYGGSLIKSWQREGEWLTATLDGVNAEDRTRDFRMIEVNGTCRQRARLPEQGAFRHPNAFDVEWLSTFAGGWKRQPMEEEMMTLRVNASDVGTWLDCGNAELTIYHEWDESLVGVSHVEQAQVQMSGADQEDECGVTEIHFANAPGHPPGAFYARNDNAMTYAVWNVREGLRQPGQWYLDRTAGKLVYWPLPEESEHPESLRVIAPAREQLLRLEEGANRIRIAGLTFACAATPLSAGGFGAIHVSAAIQAEEVEEVEFDRVTVRNTGGWAFQLSGKHIRLNECHVHHTGAGGIQWKGEAITLECSRIHDVGLVYSSAIAVNSDGAGHTIGHNEIHDTPYSGIASSSSNTTISSNLLYNTMNFMKDGSAIYLSWYSDQVNVSGNAVFAKSKEHVRRYAYYLDEKCTNCTVERNLAVNLGLPMLSHMTRDCRYISNIFLDRGPQVLSVYNTFGLVFERNVLEAESIKIISTKGNPSKLPSAEYDEHPYMSTFSAADGIASFRDNVLHSRSGVRTFSEVLHYTKIGVERELQEQDGNVFADPQLKGADSGELIFEARSVTNPRGIEPLSFADVGCQGRYAEVFEQFK
ncbi:right-handed parallel beta-helix repeat-containing protein [Paenibacillus sp. OV219]|uniref:right-handed parallel beta-helix repeat-containing protein n=1 Tax=Paenibacillus sp. OV219 TaxID=1884377 RepID=UPI0008BB5EDD|nr:right-handed parallel beta-helix repeat-containing protein [Paenibacillus sp. OV219]SEO94397.1 Right handed beta helix region [Paenibacillus sp. OV219]